MANKEKRIRRTPEEAQQLILDAAETSMGTEGPAALRLQDVAKAVGISHATILHHFGSREGLVKALHRRALERLRGALLGRMGSSESSEDGVARSFAAFRDGMARSILWLMQLPEDDLKPAPGAMAMIDHVAQGLHSLRLSLGPPGATVDYADSRAVAHLVAVTAFGDALIGDKLRELSGQDKEEGRRYFERWVSALIDLHMRSYHDDAVLRS